MGESVRRKRGRGGRGVVLAEASGRIRRVPYTTFRVEDWQRRSPGIVEMAVLEGGGDGGQLYLVVDGIVVLETVGAGGMGNVPVGPLCGIALLVLGVVCGCQRAGVSLGENAAAFRVGVRDG